jgi:RNA polymerase sigma factor (sigma-70 family)
MASDADLIRAARGDPAAFEALVKRHASLLQRWFMAQTNDVAVSHELVAEAFAQAWLGARRFRVATEDAGAAWLYGIARNLLRQHFKRGRVETAARRRLAMSSSACHDDGVREINDRIDAQDLSPAVREAFAELSPEQQQAIAYRVIGDLSYREVAVRLDCSTATARKRVSRGLHALRTSIAKGAHT